LLDKDEVNRWFLDLKAFAYNLFGTNKNIKIQVYYNCFTKRIDIKAFDHSNYRYLIVSYEPGWPEDYIEDYWIED